MWRDFMKTSTSDPKVRTPSRCSEPNANCSTLKLTDRDLHDRWVCCHAYTQALVQSTKQILDTAAAHTDYTSADAF